MCFWINYMLEWEPLIQEAQVYGIVIRLGKKQLFCRGDTILLIAIMGSACRVESLTEARRRAVGLSQCESQGSAMMAKSLQVGTNLLCIRAQLFQAWNMFGWMLSPFHSGWFVESLLAFSKLKMGLLSRNHLLEHLWRISSSYPGSVQ